MPAKREGTEGPLDDLDGVASRARTLVVPSLASASGPFHRLGLGPMQAGWLRKAFGAPSIEDVRWPMPPLTGGVLELPGLPLVVEAQWVAWLHGRQGTRGCDVRLNDNETIAVGCPQPTGSRQMLLQRDEERVVQDVCVLAYLLECAMRRLVLHLVAPEYAAEANRSKSAVHSVLLKDISATILSEARRAPWSASVCCCSDTTLLSALEVLHHEFVDPNGLNLRNVVMHGYLHPLVPPSWEAPLTGEAVVMDASARLLLAIRDCLMSHLGTVVASAAAATAHAGRRSTALLPMVGLEREPRRQEATSVLMDSLDALAERASSSKVIVARDVHNVSWEAACVSAIAAMVYACPRFEALLRLLAVTAAAADGDGDAAVHAYVPAIGQQFDDLDALMARCSACVDVRHLDALFSMAPAAPCNVVDGGVTPQASMCVGRYSGAGSWSWWCVLLVVDAGPRIRDLLFHGKWSPLSHHDAERSVGRSCCVGGHEDTGADASVRHQSVARSMGFLAAMVQGAVRNAELRLLPASQQRASEAHCLTSHDVQLCDALDDDDVRNLALVFHPLRLLQRRLQAWYDSACGDAGATCDSKAADPDVRSVPALTLSPGGASFCFADAAASAVERTTTPMAGADVDEPTPLTSPLAALWLRAQSGDVDDIARAAQAAVPVAMRCMGAAVLRVLSPPMPPGAWDGLSAVCIGEIHAVLTNLDAFWALQGERHRALLDLVAARRARESQRKNAAIGSRVRRPLIDLCFRCVAGHVVHAASLVAHCATSSDTEAIGLLRRRCREASAVLSPNNTQALAKVMHAMMEPHHRVWPTTFQLACNQ